MKLPRCPQCKEIQFSLKKGAICNACTMETKSSWGTGRKKHNRQGTIISGRRP